MIVEYHTKPQGQILAEYAEDRSRVSIIIGPLGSGKTYQTCQKIFDIMIGQAPDDQGVRKTRWYAVRNTYSELLSTTAKDWLELYGELGKFKMGGKEPPCHRLKFALEDGTTVESEMYFIAFDRDDHVKKIRGSQLTGVWLSEAKELNKSVVDMLDGRHGRYPRNYTWRGMVGDTNAPDTDHWLYKLAEEIKPNKWKFFKQPGGVMRQGAQPNGKSNWVINPKAENINNLPEGGAYYIDMVQGKTDDWIAVNLANEYGYVASGKPVFPDYSDNLHCAKFEFIEDVPIYRGWDFGIAACVLTQYTPKGRFIVRKEFVATQTTGIDSFADHVLHECASLKRFQFIDVGDPAGMSKSMTDEKTCFQILEGKGIEIQPSIQNLVSRLEGVRYFLTRLIEAAPAFYIHPDCKQSRKGFQGGYCFRRVQVAGERYTDKPDKNLFSHPMDCIQYICAYIRAGYGDDAPAEDNRDEYENSFSNSNPVTGY